MSLYDDDPCETVTEYFCQCGERIYSHYKYCPKCGEKLNPDKLVKKERAVTKRDDYDWRDHWC